MTDTAFSDGSNGAYDHLSESGRGRLADALRGLAESGAKALQVARAAVWLFGPDRERLTRLHLYHRSSGEHTAGGELRREEASEYFDALEEGGVIGIRDATRDPRTRTSSALREAATGITAWIDAPVGAAGGGAPPRGIVRFEHLGPSREWTRGEQALAEGFGRALGTLLSHFEGERTPLRPARSDPEPVEEESDAGEEPTSGLRPASEEVLRRSPAGIAVLSAQGEIHFCNPAFARMLGYDEPGGATGGSLRDVCPRTGDWDELVTLVRDRGRVEGREVRVDRSDDGHSWLLLGATRLEDHSLAGPFAGDGERLLLSAMNITDRKTNEERLERLANQDPLTGIANRRFLQVAAENALALADRHGRQVALLYLDLRRFKAVNDRFGHEVGDRVLTHVADRLRARGRESDLTARIGGDEFAVLLSEVDDGVEGAERAAERLMRSLRAPVEVGHRTIDVEVTIGIAVYPDHARDVRSLLRLADEAMYRGKAWEEGQIVVWNEDVSASPDGETRMSEGEAPDRGRGAALPDREQLDLHWQPIQRGSNGEVIGAEALLRGRHPDRGLLSAGEFVGQAIEQGSITSFDLWVLERAVEQLGEWRDAGTVDWIAVNVAPQSLLDPDYMETLDRLVESGALPPYAMLIQTWMRREQASASRVGTVLQSLRDRGFGISLDLTGLSEESRGVILSVLDVDVLEVTPQLLTPAEDGRLGGALGSARRDTGALWLAKKLETEEEYSRARATRCELIEGYLLGRPGPARSLHNGNPGPGRPSSEPE